MATTKQQQRYIAEKEAIETHQPKLNKNTEKYLEARRRRIEEEGPSYKSKRGAEPALPQKTTTKATDRHLLNKFNREFDAVAEALIDITELEVDLQLSKKEHLAKSGNLSVTGKVNEIGTGEVDENGEPIVNANGEEDQQEMQQFSPHPERRKDEQPKKKGGLNEFLGAPMNYIKLKDICVELGLLTEVAALTNDS